MTRTFQPLLFLLAGGTQNQLIRQIEFLKAEKDFDATLNSGGIEPKRVGPKAPNMLAYVERWVQSIKQECLDKFIVFGEAHLNCLSSQYAEHYHLERPHQSLDNLPLSGDRTTEKGDLPTAEEITCQERRGGLLKHFCRRAA